MNTLEPQSNESQTADEQLNKETLIGVEKAALTDEQMIVKNEDPKDSLTSLLGNLERYDKFTLVGWATTADGDPVEVQVRIDGVIIDCDTIRQRRMDVIDVLGISNPNVGYKIELPSKIWGMLSKKGGQLELLGNGEPLTPEPIALTSAVAVEWIADIIRMDEGPEKQYLLHLAMQHVQNGNLFSKLPLASASFISQYSKRTGFEIEVADNTTFPDITEKSGTQPVSKRSYVERMDKFILEGWAIDKDDGPADLNVLVNGDSVEFSIIRLERQDVADVLNITNNNVGFSIELPGYIWENLAKDGGQIEIIADGKALTAKPLELNRLVAIKWISEIFMMVEGQEKLYLGLLALEHVRYGNFLPELLAKDARLVRHFAERMQLEDFLLVDAAQTNDKVLDETDTPSESMATLLLWRALSTLNKRITEKSPAIFDQAKAVIRELWLQGETHDLFLIAIVPPLCKTGEFLRLRELIPFSRLQQLANVGNLWEVTLSIPAFVADNQIDRATDTLYRAAKSLDKGWLNTECIHFSLQLLQRKEADGEVEIAIAEKFRYAILALLDAFQGDWFSRLHDQNLIDCMLLLLSDINSYTDYHRRDVVIAAQRIYGLNPDFWMRAVNLQLPGFDRELARSHAHFKKLYEAFTVERTLLTDWLEEIAEPLAYYRAKNNPEALIFLREICAHILPSINESLPTRAKALLSKLLSGNPAEAVRVAAFPLPANNRLLEIFPETAPEMLRETLRSLSDPDKSVAWHLQENASAALIALQKAEHANPVQVGQALALLEQRAITLANWQGCFLAFDLLASGYAIASEHGSECSSLLTRMLWILKRSVDESKGDFFLPAPVLAGLVRLSGNLAKTDSILRGFLAECRRIILGKFGERMDDLFVLPKQPQLHLKPSGWPQDTLVVIYSCRKYLDTRVKAIRETWVQDLKARGIPYLVLVGDGDDSINGDVLALDVSDKYEDLPKKSLKLFDWVYHNTDAQYVLKIDDDCYLDVSRFFDTLSYRKYYYYGRVIRREVGSMDRAWHQSKSHTSHSRKSIDKSPEPSVYADGGGGYTLSRLAMQQLLKAEKTKQGERLLASSFMEEKLVGDLLSLYYILPSNEDYDSYQRRRTFGEAMPVGLAENGFFPCLSTPTKMVHLDSHLDVALTHDKASSKELWPKKLWPTCWSPSIKHNKNQLELISDLSQTNSLLKHGLLLISVVRNEMIMLPSFLAHYRSLGIKSFVMVDNCSDDGTREYLFKQPDVILFSADTEYRPSHYGVAWQQAVLGNLCLNKWALLVDADELLVYEGYENKPIQELIVEIESEGANALRTDMIDMYPYGDLEEADFAKANPFDAAPWFDNPPLIHWKLGSGMYSNGPTFLSSLRHRLADPSAPNAFTSQKYGLIRYQPWVRYSQGLHDVSNVKVSNKRAWFAHFKYHAGFKAKVETEIRRGQHFNNAEEYRRYAAMLAEGNGGFGETGISSRYDANTLFSPK